MSVDDTEIIQLYVDVQSQQNHIRGRPIRQTSPC